jgi:Fe-S-cluster containining protein
MMNDAQPSPEQSLCLSCGLCCNGTIFMRVPLKATDKIAPLQAAGIEIRQKADTRSNETRKSFRLPCAAFQQNCCQVYDDRPAACRKFRCELLKKFDRGEVLWADARQKIVYVQQLREKLGKEISKTLPEYEGVSIPALLKTAPTREEMLADPVLFKKWASVLMLLAALQDRIQADFHLPLQKY